MVCASTYVCNYNTYFVCIVFVFKSNSETDCIFLNAILSFFQTQEVERLLKIGSSIYSLDSEGDTPLDLASRAGNIVSTQYHAEIH